MGVGRGRPPCLWDMASPTSLSASENYTGHVRASVGAHLSLPEHLKTRFLQGKGSVVQGARSSVSEEVWSTQCGTKG